MIEKDPKVINTLNAFYEAYIRHNSPDRHMHFAELVGGITRYEAKQLCYRIIYEGIKVENT